MGPIHWSYLPECLTDTQFGFIATFHYMNGVEISAASEYMMAYLTPAGMFAFYAIITIFGTFFIHYFVQDTAGLTDKEKMQLYLPEEYKDKEFQTNKTVE